MQNYIESHIEAGEYEPLNTHYVTAYHNRIGWDDWLLNEKILFSHRVTEYTFKNFKDAFHDHTHYELNICRSGDICFFCNEKNVSLKEGLVYLFKPNTVHTGRLNTPSLYDRYILYFDEDAFSFLTGFQPLVSFTKDSPYFFGLVNENSLHKVFSLLNQTEEELKKDTPCSNILALSYIMQVFAVITQNFDPDIPQSDELPQKVRDFRNYIDAHFKELETVGDIAKHFSYSKEYVTKLFTKYYNSHIYNYLVRKKISNSITMIEAGASVTDACYQSGFNNMTSFSRYFKLATGTSPLKYKKMK